MLWIENLRYLNWNQAGGLCLFAYILGCFTSGYYLVRWITGKDLRELGSGTVGARNAARVLGKTGFLLTVLCDFGKGSFTVWAARQFTTDDRLVALALLSVVVGHIWPAQLRFHGGKGMATSLGALIVYDAHLTLCFIILFLCLFVGFRRTTLPGLFALACLPIAAVLLDRGPTAATLLTLLAGLVTVAHRKNLFEEFSQLASRRHSQPESEHPPL